LDKKDRLKLQLAIDEADSWAKRYRKAMDARNATRTAAALALKQIRNALVPVPSDGATFYVLPLAAGVLTAIGTFAGYLSTPPVSADDQELLHQLELEVPRAVVDAGRITAGKLGRVDDDAADAAEYLNEYVPWGLAEHIPAALDRITPPEPVGPVAAAYALQPKYGLAKVLQPYGEPQLLPADALRADLTSPATAPQNADLARALNAAEGYVVLCCPPGKSPAQLIVN